jgi:hypothetical protein
MGFHDWFFAIYSGSRFVGTDYYVQVIGQEKQHSAQHWTKILLFPSDLRDKELFVSVLPVDAALLLLNVRPSPLMSTFRDEASIHGRQRKADTPVNLQILNLIPISSIGGKELLVARTPNTGTGNGWFRKSNRKVGIRLSKI